MKTQQQQQPKKQDAKQQNMSLRDRLDDAKTGSTVGGAGSSKSASPAPSRSRSNSGQQQQSSTTTTPLIERFDGVQNAKTKPNNNSKNGQQTPNKGGTKEQDQSLPSLRERLDNQEAGSNTSLLDRMDGGGGGGGLSPSKGPNKSTLNSRKRQQSKDRHQERQAESVSSGASLAERFTDNTAESNGAKRVRRSTSEAGTPPLPADSTLTTVGASQPSGRDSLQQLRGHPVNATAAEPRSTNSHSREQSKPSLADRFVPNDSRRPPSVPARSLSNHHKSRGRSRSPPLPHLRQRSRSPPRSRYRYPSPPTYYDHRYDSRSPPRHDTHLASRFGPLPPHPPRDRYHGYR
ncbi:hypothetical protein ACM66B_001764 [Microbotryomycetes sp. NB124-2]